METEDLVGASVADLMRELAVRLEQSNGIEFVPTVDLHLVARQLNAELLNRRS